MKACTFTHVTEKMRIVPAAGTANDQYTRLHLYNISTMKNISEESEIPDQAAKVLGWF